LLKWLALVKPFFIALHGKLERHVLHRDMGMLQQFDKLIAERLTLSMPAWSM